MQDFFPRDIVVMSKAQRELGWKNQPRFCQELQCFSREPAVPVVVGLPEDMMPSWQQPLVC